MVTDHYGLGGMPRPCFICHRMVLGSRSIPGVGGWMLLSTALGLLTGSTTQLLELGNCFAEVLSPSHQLVCSYHTHGLGSLLRLD